MNHFENKFLQVLLILILALGTVRSFSQEKKLLTEKPGSFKITKEPLNGQGPDLYGKECYCSKGESDGMLGKLESLVQVFRQTPVLAANKGFDGVCRLYGGRCSSKYGYAVPADVKFWFKSWSLFKGRESQWVNEPPQYIVEVNQLDKFRDNGFNESDFSNAYNPTNPAFSEKAQHETTVALNELFYLPGVREVMRQGVDRYGDHVVIYNPGRPPYWEQVTIRETFRLLLNYWECMPDKAAVDVMVPMLKNELAGFSEAEKEGYAYFGNPETISRIGSDANETPVVRPNPAYWNRNLPKSTIQFIVFELPQPDIVKSKMEKYLKNGDGYYYVYRLMKELDINSLRSSITQ